MHELASNLRRVRVSHRSAGGRSGRRASVGSLVRWPPLGHAPTNATEIRKMARLRLTRALPAKTRFRQMGLALRCVTDGVWFSYDRLGQSRGPRGAIPRNRSERKSCP
jgi:hypothetical protein